CAALAGATGARAELVSLAGTAAEVSAFYVVMIARERAARPSTPLGAVLRGLALEFGPAEALDTFLLRPALLYAGVALTGGAAGALLGKLAADGVFYALAISCRALASPPSATLRCPRALPVALEAPSAA